jgi:hypothetical protein
VAQRARRAPGAALVRSQAGDASKHRGRFNYFIVCLCESLIAFVFAIKCSLFILSFLSSFQPFPSPLPSATTPISNVYVGGGFIGGYKEGIARWRDLYYTMMFGSVYADTFVGKDQHQMGSTCLETPDLCFLVQPTNEVRDKWFFVASYLAGKTSANPLV